MYTATGGQMHGFSSFRKNPSVFTFLAFFALLHHNLMTALVVIKVLSSSLANCSKHVKKCCKNHVSVTQVRSAYSTYPDAAIAYSEYVLILIKVGITVVYMAILISEYDLDPIYIGILLCMSTAQRWARLWIGRSCTTRSLQASRQCRSKCRWQFYLRFQLLLTCSVGKKWKCDSGDTVGLLKLTVPLCQGQTPGSLNHPLHPLSPSVLVS